MQEIHETIAIPKLWLTLLS